jgi:hypothetical protein
MPSYYYLQPGSMLFKVYLDLSIYRYYDEHRTDVQTDCTYAHTQFMDLRLSVPRFRNLDPCMRSETLDPLVTSESVVRPPHPQKALFDEINV